MFHTHAHTHTNPLDHRGLFSALRSKYIRLDYAAVCIFSDITQETGNPEGSSLPLSEQWWQGGYKPLQNRQASGRQVCLWTSYRSQSLCWTDWHKPPIFKQIKPLWWLYDWHLLKVCILLSASSCLCVTKTWVCPVMDSVFFCRRLLGWTPASPVTLITGLMGCSYLNSYNWILPFPKQHHNLFTLPVLQKQFLS